MHLQVVSSACASCGSRRTQVELDVLRGTGAMGLLSGHDHHTARYLSMNVGGTRTVIPRGELSRRAPPRSRLARLAHLTKPGPRLCDDFDAATGEVYFDRSATIFAAVAHYLHTGHLHSVSGVCPSAFRAEMAYWGVPCGLLSPCCRPLRSRRREAGHSESSNSESESEIDSGEESDGCWEEDDEQPWIGFEQENESPGSRQTGCSCSRYRQKLWHLLEKPETSFPSRLVSIVSISAVMTSLALLCLQSLPFYRLGSTTINTSKSSIPLPPATLLPVLEGVMMAWFSVEFVLRWLASPDRRRFLWKPLNAIDLACLVPFYVEIGLDQVGSEPEENGHELVTLVQTLRVLRTLKLARHSSGVRQLGSAMHLAAPDVAALGLALAVVVCLFASAAYLLEAETGEGLASIPAGIWWALITMTTVGYGDSYPKTVGGKLVAGACVLSGTLAMALPVTVIFGAFHRQYKTKRKKGED